MKTRRVLSGMRPTGKLHLGHYHGVLDNWRKLQSEYQCLFCIADWHALTTHYENSASVADNSLEVLIDWLVSGIDPKQSIPFVQSHVAQHAELHLALSMITPLGWLERVPTYKDQKKKLSKLDLSTYGFLGYPVLQAADILVYQAELVPVGEDQVAHIEMSREIARRFNYIFGRDAKFHDTKENALALLSTDVQKTVASAQRSYSERGEEKPVQQALQAIGDVLDDRQKSVLHAWMTNRGRSLLVEPQAMLMENAARLPGTDGQKMSKSYGNTIFIRDETDTIANKIQKMPTDPARIRRSDPGNPEKCPVWDFHVLHTAKSEQQRIDADCRSANIGCVQCKGMLCERIIEQSDTFNAKAKTYTDDKAQLLNILKRGNEQASEIASQTMVQLRKAMNLLD